MNVKECDTSDRYALESLGLGVYQHVIVLSDDRYSPSHADTRTLMTLLQLRDMQTSLGERYSIVSEMHDENNRSLAEVTKADDIVISDTVIGLLLAQLAENQHLAEVFGYLFDSRGLGDLSSPGGPLCPARGPGRLRLGDRVGPPPRRDRDRLPPGGPGEQGSALRRRPQSRQVRPLDLGPDDSVIVLAEH